MKRLLKILFIIAPILSWGQYEYFERIHGDSSDNILERTPNIEVFNGNYFGWGIAGNDSTVFYHIDKYDLFGDSILEKRLEFPNEYFFTGTTQTFKVDEEGNFYAYGTKIDTISIKGFLIKFNSNLDTLWTKEYTMYEPDTQIDGGYLTETSLLISGSYGTAPGQRGSYIAELDLDGNLLWHNSIHLPNEGVFRNRFISPAENGFVVSGTDGAGEDTEGRIEYLNENGELQWFLEGEGDIYNGSILHVIDDNDTYIALQSVSHTLLPMATDPWDAYFKIMFYVVNPITEDYDYVFEFLDSEELIFTGLIDLIEASDGGWVILGSSEKMINNIRQDIAFAFKVNEDYELEWYKEYAYQLCPSCTNVLYDIEQAPDGGYIMAGNYYDVYSSDPYSKTWLVKVDACGDLEFNGCWPVGVNEIEMQSMQLNAYPNPAKDYIAIEFQNWREELILTMVDMNGKIVFSKRVNPTGIELIDVSDYSSGMYQIIAKSVKTRQVNSLKIEVQH